MLLQAAFPSSTYNEERMYARYQLNANAVAVKSNDDIPSISASYIHIVAFFAHYTISFCSFYDRDENGAVELVSDGATVLDESPESATFLQEAGIP
jgi:hypothetical protein